MKASTMHSGNTPERPLGRRGQWALVITLVALLMKGELMIPGMGAAARNSPIRIGVLTASWGPTPQVVGIRDGMLALGYRENEDFVLGIRFTKGDHSALPGAARELVQYGVDLIIVDTDESAQAAQQATAQIPIVFTSVADPVGLGLVESYARPGGNITGVTDLDLQLGEKRLEVFQQIIPGLRRVLFPYDPTDAYAGALVKRYREAAQHLGITLVERAVRTEAEAQALQTKLGEENVDGVLGPRCCSLDVAGLVLRATSERMIPAMYSTTFFVEQGALASYGADTYATGKQTARLVDKVIKGVSPAELPVEVNPKVTFAINLKTAKALGLNIAPEVLFQADRIIR